MAALNWPSQTILRARSRRAASKDALWALGKSSSLRAFAVQRNSKRCNVSVTQRGPTLKEVSQQHVRGKALGVPRKALTAVIRLLALPCMRAEGRAKTSKKKRTSHTMREKGRTAPL
jgi:hypothetical protein